MEISNSILATAKRIIEKYTLCSECFGRQFALVGTGLTNSERSNSIFHYLISEYTNALEKITENSPEFLEILKKLRKLANHSNFQSLEKIIQKYDPNWLSPKEFTCYLCNNLFLKIDHLVKDIVEKAIEYEFSNYLVGTSLTPKIIDKEDEFRARLDINTGESFKRNLNRETGKRLEGIWKRSVEFDNPELTIMIQLERKEYTIGLLSNPLCVRGRYRKFMRGIPQTHWPHKKCRGKGCKECNFTGKQYPTSVEELISPYFLKYSKAVKSVFHGAGREDIDARCIGTGRPFIIELKEPKVRSIDLDKIQNELQKNDGNKVEIFDLEFVPRSEIKNLKSSGETTSKTYEALILSKKKLNRRKFKKKIKSVRETVLEKQILQRTPLRVVHRRADLTRKRSIFDIEFKWINKHHFRAKIKAMGGTYIKELISGDEGRTKPSLAELFGIPLKCKELDIIDVGKL
jgi:tRNA pseudouridine synthase 10